jgi:hypothetical protein
VTVEIGWYWQRGFDPGEVWRMTRLQWIFTIIGVLVALSMILSVLPIGR